jgi:restriction system protein
MTLWICKGGNRGQREDRMIEHDIIGIGWEDLNDLSKIKNRSELRKLYEITYPNSKKGRISNHVGQILSFLMKVKKGDTIVVPLKTTRKIAVGTISGDYKYTTDYGSDMNHVRKVKWFVNDALRTSFESDLLYSFGAFMTFCQARAKNAEERVLKIIKAPVPDTSQKEESPELYRDIEDESLNQISDYISQKMKGHELANLIGAILSAQGYTATISPPGPDGGVDITASKGHLGFQDPKLCVQVKSGNSSIGISTYNQLKGTMASINATHGLFVSWGGFKTTVQRAQKQDIFQIKLWGPQEIMQNLFQTYSEIDPEMKSKIPLKQIWTITKDTE